MTAGCELSGAPQDPINFNRPYFAEHLLPPGSSFPTAIALSIFDSSTTYRGKIVPSTTKILACVRDPKTNLTDQDVISLPTERVPTEFAQNALQQYSIANIVEIGSGAHGKRVVVRWKDRKVRDTRGIEPAHYLARSLMRGKLDVAGAIEDGSLKIVSAVPRTSIFGTVYGTNADPVNGTEQLHMLGIRTLVEFKKDTNPFPDKTESYYGIQFMRTDEFSEMVTNKNPRLISRFGDFTKLCIYGLCGSTGVDIINRDSNTRG
jgi:hypothetical protein